MVAYFKLSEFKCRCMREICPAVAMDLAFLAKLSEFRLIWCLPLIVNSGTRCEFWNRKVGGKPDSQHLLGKAADIKAETPSQAKKLSALADTMGFGGIGVAERFVHVDTGPEGRRWTYPSKEVVNQKPGPGT